MVPARRRRSAEPRADRGARGFTLVEILVALAVLAVALTAGLRAVAQAADGASMLKQRTLALWVAQNRLAAAQLDVTWPAPGRRDGEAEQAGGRFVWRENVTDTPNPAFRKIEIIVAAAGEPDYVLARLSGFLGQPPER